MANTEYALEHLDASSQCTAQHSLDPVGRTTDISDVEITVTIPDELADRLGNARELERRALEALAIKEFKLGHLTKPELRRLLGIRTRAKLDEFLKTHGLFEPYTLDDRERERHELARLDF